MFQKLRRGNNRIDDESRPRISIDFEADILQTLVKQTPIGTIGKLTVELEFDHTTIHRRLYKFKKTSKLDFNLKYVIPSEYCPPTSSEGDAPKPAAF